MSNKLFITCDEAATICTKNQYKEASFWEKIKLNIHLFRCKICGLYSKHNTKITEVCDRHLRKTECEHKLTEKDKEVLKKRLIETDK